MPLPNLIKRMSLPHRPRANGAADRRRAPISGASRCHANRLSKYGMRPIRRSLGSEHIIADQLVLDVVEGSTLTAYDAEFVALASALSVPLVTADKALLKAFRNRALTMEAFVSR